MFGLAGRKDDPAPALLEPSSGTTLSHAQLYARVMERAATLPRGSGPSTPSRRASSVGSESLANSTDPVASSARMQPPPTR